MKLPVGIHAFASYVSESVERKIAFFSDTRTISRIHQYNERMQHQGV